LQCIQPQRTKPAGKAQAHTNFIHAHENDPDPSVKLAQDFDESKYPRDERGRFVDRGNARTKSKLESLLRFGKVTSKSRLEHGLPEGKSQGIH
jgi:hypothetical protein